ncbi:hypothetical protein FSP39_010273 [Pinctada imbricata]|uniref:Cadherin domain-containing protein n=1 Tax=Pinctada imbricata TaxID=66713 RepID=A0AA88Y707_PINIB|nr:hypothetical protein FSP39_010273 [Pinctada imbricata]
MMAAPFRQLFLLLALDMYTTMTYGQEVSLNYDIYEEQSRETFVGNVAVDSYLKANVTPEELDRMRFQILTQGNPDAAYFTINEISSTIKTAQVLDRETICELERTCTLEFSVAVYKQDPQRDNQLDLYKVFAIKVNIKDSNDNAPVFPAPEISLSVQESVPIDYVLLTSGAIDRDMGENNSVQSYELVPSNEMFALEEIKNLDGSSDLGLKVRFKLDRETQDFYQVRIIAKDGGFPQRSGVVTVNITIIDTNDNKPLFNQAAYNVTISENTEVGTPVLQLSAQDSDIGENGEFSFAFSARTPQKVRDSFAINSTSGEIYVVDKTDYEQVQQYQFLVEVKDKGREPLSSTATVTIGIKDENDNAPQININLPPGGADIPEDAEIDRYVATLSVSDEDSGTNGNVRCEIPGNKFKLEKLYDNLFKILVSGTLDYETQKIYNVTIQCEDQGVPQRRNSSSFFINVQDTNDNPPVFQQAVYRKTMNENNNVNAYITTVRATDLDSGDNKKITYSLHTDGYNFNINPTSGVITAKKSFDRELDPEIHFHVNATDHGSPSKSSACVVILTLADENDEPPIFRNQHFEFYVPEERTDMPIAGTLVASDPDAGSNGQFTFDFASPKLPEFELDRNTGEIRAGKLDRELRTEYNFTVRVTDKGNPPLSSTAKVTIHVIDDNDNMPKIIYPDNHNNTVYLPYTAPAGTLIAQIRAYDIDEGENSKLSYYIDQIRPNNPEIFKMGDRTGRLSIAKTMHLYDANTYNIVIGVRDSGSQHYVMYANLNVVVTVSNQTVLPTSQPSGGDSNIVIVVAIVVVTLVLSIAIIAAIFIVRRFDKSRSHGNDKCPAKTHEQQISNGAKRHESLSTESSHLSDFPMKNKKKEVSFSINDETDSMNASTLTTFSSFKNHPSAMSSIDGKTFEIPQASSSLLTSDVSSGKGSEKTYLTDLYSEPPGYDPLCIQHLGHEDARKLYYQIKKPDDAESEMSAESATSDSGRGGSEEDIHSNRGHPLSDNEDIRQTYPSDIKPGERFRHVPTKHSNSNVLHSNFPGKAVPANDSYPRNISFSDDSVTANTTVDTSAKNRTRNKSSESAISKKNLSHYSHNSYNSPRRTHTHQELYYDDGHSHLETLNEATQDTFGIRYSLQDIDDTVSESVITRDDDGNSTTTSGSYTINPDELVNEIDNLFFKDVIV